MSEFAFFGEDARFHHVGLGVYSIEAAHPGARVLTNQREGVSLAFVDLHGLTVELLEPLGEGSPIARNLQKGARLLHLCFEVPDLEVALERCRPAGFHRLRPPAESPALANRRTVWVFSNEFGLFELLERSP